MTDSQKMYFWKLFYQAVSTLPVPSDSLQSREENANVVKEWLKGRDSIEGGESPYEFLETRVLTAIYEDLTRRACFERGVNLLFFRASYQEYSVLGNEEGAQERLSSIQRALAIDESTLAFTRVLIELPDAVFDADLALEFVNQLREKDSLSDEEALAMTKALWSRMQLPTEAAKTIGKMMAKDDEEEDSVEIPDISFDDESPKAVAAKYVGDALRAMGENESPIIHPSDAYKLPHGVESKDVDRFEKYFGESAIQAVASEEARRGMQGCLVSTMDSHFRRLLTLFQQKGLDYQDLYAKYTGLVSNNRLEVQEDFPFREGQEEIYQKIKAFLLNLPEPTTPEEQLENLLAVWNAQKENESWGKGLFQRAETTLILALKGVFYLDA